MDDDTYTVVVTCYREGDLLQRAIESLRAQTDQDFEVLVINDASPCDNTNEICRSLEEGDRLRVVWRRRNGGLSAARNDGFRYASGSICLFLDADDELPSETIAVTREAFRRHPESDFVFGNYIRRDVEDDREELVDCSFMCGPDLRLTPAHLLERWILSGHTPCRKMTWQRAGKYRREFSYGYQDVDFWMRALYRGCKGFYTPHVIYYWNRSSRGMNEQRAPRWRYYRARSIKYYEAMGPDPNIWKRVVLDFLDHRHVDAIRRDARAAWRYLIPKQPDRWSLFLRFTAFVCGPTFLTRALHSSES